VHEVTRATTSVYEANAADYAAATWDYANFPRLLEALECFEHRIPPTGPVLDLGCGAGRDTGQLLARGFEVVAADVSAEMLRRTRARCGEAIPVRLDLTQLPFQAGTFAGAWACASFVHIHSGQLAQALCELARVLKPGAPAAISMKTGEGEGWAAGTNVIGQRWFNLMPPDQFADALSAAGFGNVTISFRGRPEWYVATGLVTRPE
jgi:ubiquinone/menaquinone biosynthesis C-methylase UbiE